MEDLLPEDFFTHSKQNTWPQGHTCLGSFSLVWHILHCKLYSMPAASEEKYEEKLCKPNMMSRTSTLTDSGISVPFLLSSLSTFISTLVSSMSFSSLTNLASKFSLLSCAPSNSLRRAGSVFLILSSSPLTFFAFFSTGVVYAFNFSF